MATTRLITIQTPSVQIQFMESVMRWKVFIVGGIVEQQIRRAVLYLYYRQRRTQENVTSSCSGLSQWCTREIYANHETNVHQDILIASRDVFVAFA